MRRPVTWRPLVTACVVLAASACTSATNPPPSTTLVLTRTPDFSAQVSKAAFEGGNGPDGPYAQYDLWVTIPPASAANAGVVVPAKAPVFVRSGGRLTAASPRDIRVGDHLQVWMTHPFVAYGAVQGPPDAPTYEGSQVVILR